MFDTVLAPAPTTRAMKEDKTMPRIFLSNACHLTNKMDELECVLQDNRVDIAVITESSFKTEKEGISKLEEYKTFNKNREVKDGGGITVLIKNDIPCTVIQVDAADLEIIWLPVRPTWLPQSIGVIIIAALYFPPKSSAATRD